MALSFPVSIQTAVVQQHGITIYYPQVMGLQYKTAEQRINQTIAQLAQKLIKQQYHEQEVDVFDQMIGSFEIKNNQRHILSLTLSNYAIAKNHANGLTIMKALTFDTETGDDYSLKSLFKSDADYVSELSRQVMLQIKQRNIPVLDNFTKIKPNQDYYIADKCLVLFFQPYELAPHYFGFPMFPISIFSLEDIIDENGPLGKMATNS